MNGDERLDALIAAVDAWDALMQRRQAEGNYNMWTDDLEVEAVFAAFRAFREQDT